MNQRGFLFDTRETPEQELAAAQYLGKLHARSTALAAKWADPPRPRDGSVLIGVDAFNPYEPISQQIHNFVTVGIDNVRSTLAYINKTREIPMMALYAMIRSAIEASSFGLWLSHAGTKHKQAWLGLRLSYGNNEDLGSLESVWAASAEEEFPALDVVRKKLIAYQQAIPNYRTHDITGSPKITQIVQEADKAVRSRFYFTGIQAWKACSAMAHANFPVQRVVLEHQQIGSTGEVLHLEFRSRVMYVAAFLSAAIENLETLIPRYEEMCAPPSRGQRRR
jgi:hypothetical protein